MEHLTCSECGGDLVNKGVQQNVIAGTEADLMHCGNSSCAEFELTRAYNQREISLSVEDLAERRNAIEARARLNHRHHSR